MQYVQPEYAYPTHDHPNCTSGCCRAWALIDHLEQAEAEVIRLQAEITRLQEEMNTTKSAKPERSERFTMATTPAIKEVAKETITQAASSVPQVQSTALPSRSEVKQEVKEDIKKDEHKDEQSVQSMPQSTAEPTRTATTGAMRAGSPGATRLPHVSTQRPTQPKSPPDA